VEQGIIPFAYLTETIHQLCCKRFAHLKGSRSRICCDVRLLQMLACWPRDCSAQPSRLGSALKAAPP
jgi:hypothetical protein